MVSQSLVAERGNGKALLLDARHDECEEKLDDDEANVNLESILGGVCILLSARWWNANTHLVDVAAESLEEWLNVAHGSRVNHLALVEPKADPEVV